MTYLCGGINGLSDADCKDWREVAKAKLLTPTLDPMRRDFRGKEDDNILEIVHGDIEDIKNCDFILVNATRPSWGTAMEVLHAALTHTKNIIAFVGPNTKVSPWLRFYCNEIVDSVEMAVDIINREYLRSKNLAP